MYSHTTRINIEEKAKVVAALGEKEVIQFLAAQAILHLDDLKRRKNIITATWRNGCFENMDDHPDHTTPNHYSPKMDILQ